jgi:type II secretory pathway pseudopilin PulG
MVVLKKIKSATLVESLVATVIILVVFFMASIVLNNLFSNVIKSNTVDIENYCNELEYLYKNQKIKPPYQDSYLNWVIKISLQPPDNKELVIEAINTEFNKSYIRILNVR